MKGSIILSKAVSTNHGVSGTAWQNNGGVVVLSLGTAKNMDTFDTEYAKEWFCGIVIVGDRDIKAGTSGNFLRDIYSTQFHGEISLSID